MMDNTISKSQLKARMFEIFRSLEASGDEMIVTDHGKPVLKIVPIKEKATTSELFGDHQGRVIYHEDIDTPTMDEWGDL
jgi:antitoxin (DNA-binding transcriptional repressor) of toxin-antitoxin stability system